MAQSVTPEELLRHARFVRAIARRLTGRGDSDDVEQQAWLRILRGGARTIEHPLTWLRSIVRSVAFDLRRRATRARANELRAARPEATASDDTVARREWVERLVGAVLRLDEPYRTVVFLRFYEGETPLAIAARLGVPRDTVRSRLRRAFELLREDLVEAPRDEATQRHAASPLPLIGISMSTRAVAAAIVAVALLGVGAWHWWPGDAPTSPAVRPYEAAPASTATAPPPASPAAAIAPLMVRPFDPRAEADESRPGPGTATAIVLGRCLAAEDSRPLGGCRVELEFSRKDGTPPEPPPPGATVSTTTRGFSVDAITGADGRFRIETVPPADLIARLILRPVSRPTCSLTPEDIHRGATEDLGDLILPRAAKIVGTVTDQEHLPVEGLTISLFPMNQNPGPRHLTASTDHSDPCTALGEFRFGCLTAPGRYAVFADREYRVVSPRTIVIADQDEIQRFDIEVAAPPPADLIEGVAVDQGGDPVSGAQVLINGRGRGATRKDGSFRVRRAPEDPASATVEIQDGGRFDAGRVPEPVAWGRRDLRVVLGSKRVLELRVVDSNGPVTTAVATCLTAASEQRRIGVRPLEPEVGVPVERDGRCTFARVAAGPVIVAVRGNAGAVAIDRFEMPESGHVVRTITLPTVIDTVIRVHTSSGDALPAVHIELIASTTGARPALGAWTVDWFDARHPPRSAIEGLLLLGRATTGATGCTRLVLPIGVDLYARIEHGGVMPDLVGPLIVTAMNPALDIIARRGATLEGVLTPESAVERIRQLAQGSLQQALSVRAYPASLDESTRAQLPRYAATVDGSRFTLDGLSPGRWKLYVSCWINIGGGRHVQEFPPESLGEFEIGGDDRVCHTFDVRIVAPARVHGIATSNGRPLGNVEITVQRIPSEANAGGRWLPAGLWVTDARGRFDGLVLPGRLRAWFGPGGESRPSMDAQSVERPTAIAPDTDSEWNLEFRDPEGR